MLPLLHISSTLMANPVASSHHKGFKAKGSHIPLSFPVLCEEFTQLENILETYEHASRQKLNKEKTSLFFSHKTSQDIQDNIKHCFGVDVIKQHETYLGLPSLVGRSKKNTFRALKGRLDHKLPGWKEKLLSQAGNEILIKTVA